jgi:hypothetical protein
MYARSKHLIHRLLFNTMLMSCASPKVSPPSDDPIMAIAAEYASLRTMRGHFDNAESNADVDAPTGRKFVVMNQLLLHWQQRLPAPVRDVQAMMGVPDELLHPGDEAWSWFVPPGHHNAAMLYHWRNRHDLLVFTIDDTTVTSAAWWMAGE